MAHYSFSHVVIKTIFMRQPLLFLLLVCGFASHAQTETGSYLVGGNLQLNAAKNNTDIQLNPTAGYFFVDNFAAGLNVDLGYSKNGALSSAFKTTTFGLGPFIRFYTGTAAVRPFLDGDVNFTSVKYDYGTNSRTYTGLKYFVGPGAAIFLNRNVAVEGLAGYEHAAYKNQLGSGGFTFKIGFQVYLNGTQVKAVTNTP
jgi:hypothetical protein